MSQFRQFHPFRALPSLRLIAGVLLAGGALGTPAQAQSDDDEVEEVSSPVVQPIPGAAGYKLNAALSLLARDPSDVAALSAAGQAALDMGDVSAAVGFFQRASTLAPANGRIKAGLASALVRSEDPFSAIPLFDEAERSGPIEPALLGERGLAYDLVGDNITAQIFYRQALGGTQDDELVRRLAVSQAIGGDRRGMELTLAPLLQKQDKAAWRARAFALAILGSPDEAESIARASMPSGLANGISGYLRYMPRLTAAQQAAAANLGHFPRAAEIGHDDPRLAAYQRPKAIIARADQSLTPAGKPLGNTKKPSRGMRIAESAPPPVAKPVPKPVTVAAAPPPPLAPPVSEKPPAPVVTVIQIGRAHV